MKKQQSGFTLVEIAIVMVIIGLLLGGVLKGQEVITNAKIKNVNNDFSAISAAMYSYQDRYRALPGDDQLANVHVNATVTTEEGDGNGIIDDLYNSTTANDESRLFWLHLRMAGLITGDGTAGSATSQTQPTSSFGGIIGIEDTAGATGFGGLGMVFQSIPWEIALLIETSSGDGAVSNTGSIRTYAATTGNLYSNSDPSVNLVFDM